MNGLSYTRGRTRLGALLLSLGLLIGASAVCALTPLADGQVIKIDQAAGKITIKHGPLKQFDMDEPMTMSIAPAIRPPSKTSKQVTKSSFQQIASMASSQS
jgi:Cu/Ag efflux protein CusF